MKLRITITIEVDDDISGDDIENVRADFQNAAYEHTMIGEPKVSIEELN